MFPKVVTSGRVETSELDPDFDFDSKMDKGKNIINTESTSIVSTTHIQPEYLEESKEGECLFHSWMWVNGVPQHFIVNNGMQKNLISIEFVNRLKLMATPHPHPYNIWWLS